MDSSPCHVPLCEQPVQVALTLIYDTDKASGTCGLQAAIRHDIHRRFLLQAKPSISMCVAANPKALNHPNLQDPVQILTNSSPTVANLLSMCLWQKAELNNSCKYLFADELSIGHSRPNVWLCDSLRILLAANRLLQCVGWGWLHYAKCKWAGYGNID